MSQKKLVKICCVNDYTYIYIHIQRGYMNLFKVT